MNSPSTKIPSHALTEPFTRPKQAGQSEEPRKKPKKVNSEIRKQQNRIASRNYRMFSPRCTHLLQSHLKCLGEKRKRKLQYLQHLIRDGSNDDQESEPSPSGHEAYARSLSADYDVAGASPSPYILPANSDFISMSSSSTAVSHPVAAATPASVNSGHHPAFTHPYAAFPPSWSPPIYSPPPPANIAWTVPSPWMSGIDYPARVAPRPDMYRYIPPPSQPVFEQAHTPLQQPQEFLTTSDLHGFSSTYGPQSQVSSDLNVSLPTSSSYYQGRYTGSH
jgi:hypothetical protein